MLSLTRIFLHNWHRFQHHVLEVDGSLYLAGHNGSGKSSVLDALQVVLVADERVIRYNSSAQDRSKRNLNTYVRGKIGENRFLRPNGAVAYIVLEFTDTRPRSASAAHLLLGVCVEARSDHSTEKLYFILTKPFDPTLFIVDGRPLPRRELRPVIRAQGGHPYEQVEEYQDQMLNRLGGLNPRFFELFIKALRFEPIRNIRDFVEQWVLPEHLVELENLRRVGERLESLEYHAKEVQERLGFLRQVVDRQAEVRRLRRLRDQWLVAKALLEVAAAQRQTEATQAQLSMLQARLAEGEAHLKIQEATLENTRTDLREAEKKLYQSGVVRHRDDLRRQINEATAQANTSRSNWDKLRQTLEREAKVLHPLQAEPALTPEEQAALRAVLDTVAKLTPEVPPASHLQHTVETLLPLLEAATERVKESLFDLRRQIKDLRERAKQIEIELDRLRRDQRVTYSPDVERMRQALEQALGARPALLCELLEIPDERWQDAVEAMLGQRRFNLVVPPQQFDRALELLDQARAREKIYDVGLIDLARAQSEARVAQPGSLAKQIQAAEPAVQTYIDTILGDIITCESVTEIRRHRRAVTPDVMVYAEWTARAVPPKRFRPWFIGARAQRSQIEAYERQLAELGNRWPRLVEQEQALARQVENLGRWTEWKALLPRFEQPLDERPWRAQAVELERELAALDLSGIQALEQDAQRLRTEASKLEKEVRDYGSELGEQREKIRTKNALLQQQRETVKARQAEAESVCQQSPEAVAEAEKLRDERLSQADLGETIRNADSTARNLNTRTENEQKALYQQAEAYNLKYSFFARADDADEDRYAQEAGRLEATELTRYSEQITQARHEADEELREHVLHRMREHIRNARVELNRLNDALAGRDFRGKVYRFLHEPAEGDLREFYDLILGTELLGANSLFESEFYRAHQTTFDRFYKTLISTPQSDSERVEQKRLTDYRRYLNYDIEMTLSDGQKSRLSRTMDQMSGGEVQTPFYLAIAASFVQLYHRDGHGGRSTLRLVAFDEAFSKMDQDHIGSTLDLFRHFQLQIITVTPLERCEYLVPKMSTNLVITSVSDTVLIEPYRNYLAKLEEVHEA